MSEGTEERRCLEQEFGYTGDASAADLVRWAIGTYHPQIALACSFQDTVLLHLVASVRPDARVFAIDTGRLPEETYACAEEARQRFGVKVEWYCPRHEALERLMGEKGTHSFRRTVSDRRECCAVRKVEPLIRALSGLKAWISGARRADGTTRARIGKLERDAAHGGILKVNPLTDWSDGDVWDYIHAHGLPYNRLFDRGYTSVGCDCCTRAAADGESARAGRWWWEDTEHKECGLHVPNWSI